MSPKPAWKRAAPQRWVLCSQLQSAEERDTSLAVGQAFEKLILRGKSFTLSLRVLQVSFFLTVLPLLSPKPRLRHIDRKLGTQNYLPVSIDNFHLRSRLIKPVASTQSDR
jgi:hypothetical protein